MLEALTTLVLVFAMASAIAQFYYINKLYNCLDQAKIKYPESRFFYLWHAKKVRQLYRENIDIFGFPPHLLRIGSLSFAGIIIAPVVFFLLVTIGEMVL